ncbi:MAG: hypothetical protein F9K32_13025 [Desulfobulbaceae bacterium]|nr:MAG: hypothetical protein F9K32_13025 [Desulfobulbaceae bacterium]
MRSTFIAIGIALSWPLSPDALVRLGNGAGQWRLGFLVGLGLATVLSGMAAAVIRNPKTADGRNHDAGSLLADGLGPLPAMTIVIASRVSLALLLSTGLLVTAGYTFNEIFVYWFPNFGFSYLLLAFILLAHLAGGRAALVLQPVFAATAVGGLASLVLLGLGSPGASGPLPTMAMPALPISTASALVLFLGYDVTTSWPDGGSRLPVLAGLSGILLLFCGWSLVSLAHLPAQRLAESTIPHILAARAIAGEAGRILMGVAVIAGTCAAVNGIFLIARRSLASLAAQNLLPGHRQGVFPDGIHVAVFAAIISVMMASGLAGASVLETYIEAALLLWLFSVAIQCLAAFRLLRDTDGCQAALAAVTGLLFAGGAVVLLSFHGEAKDIARFLAILLLSVFMVSALWLRLNRDAGGVLH